jgi:hypothetical protein
MSHHPTLPKRFWMDDLSHRVKGYLNSVRVKRRTGEGGVSLGVHNIQGQWCWKDLATWTSEMGARPWHEMGGFVAFRRRW